MKTREDFLKDLNVVKLQEKVDYLLPLANKEDEDNQNKIKDLLFRYTDFAIRPCFHKIKRGYISLEVNFVDQKGEDDFGSNFTIYWYGSDRSCHKKGIEISNGTIGSYSKEDIYQVERAKVIAKIWNDVEYVENVLENDLNYVMGELYDDYWRKRDRLIDDLMWDEEKRVREAITMRFIPGQVIECEGVKYHITKVTPKRIYHKLQINDNNLSEYERMIEKDKFIDMLYFNLDKTNLGIE